jgi:mannose-6-phosphate isomerase
VPLDLLIDRDPQRMLGAETAQRYGDRLPFLVKLLAADTALSIQVHPSLEQARAGFAAEDARGVVREAPERNYCDANHKPELLCALTPFEALCGFREVAATLAILDELALPELDKLRRMLAGDDGLRGAFTYLLADADADAITAALTGRVAGGAQSTAAAEALHVVELLSADFPGDIGIALSLLLNYVRLDAGEAIFLGAGNVHCYLRGTGIEIMANSDNVLRCALTPKHVDVAEVLAVTEFRPLVQPRVGVVEVAPDTWRYRTPVADFALDRIDLSAHDATSGDSTDFSSSGPSILLAIGAPATVWSGGTVVELAPGHAAFVPPAQFVVVQGTGDVYRATVPD